jgi:transposase-like protein
MATGTMNLSKQAKQFSDEDAARAFMEELRWGKGAQNAACPHCGAVDPYRLTSKPGSSTRKGVWKCRSCRKQFTVTVGTVFEKSHIALSKWLLAIHLLAASKKGMSAHQLHRMLGVTYEAAWFMAHRLRYAMMQGPLFELLKGQVEIDETYAGARDKKGSRRGRPRPDSHKTPVVALIERGGHVRAFPMPRVTADNLQQAITANVRQDATTMTDEFIPYRTIARRTGRKHQTVNHGAKEYARCEKPREHVRGLLLALEARNQRRVSPCRTRPPESVLRRVQLPVQPPGRDGWRARGAARTRRGRQAVDLQAASSQLWWHAWLCQLMAPSWRCYASKTPVFGGDMAKQLLKLPVGFRDAVSALLRTPPPPKEAMPERPKAKQARTTKQAKRKRVKR